jgi:hypothetical protein
MRVRNVDVDGGLFQISRVFESLYILLVCNWLNMPELGNLDMAMLNDSSREQWLNIVKVYGLQAVNEWHHCHLSLRWAIMRSIRLSNILVNPKQRIKLSDSTFEAKNINGNRSEYGVDAMNVRKLTIWEECKYLQSIDLSNCDGITDITVSAIGHGCDQLQSISVIVVLYQTLAYQHSAVDVVSYSRSMSADVVDSRTSVFQH